MNEHNQFGLKPGPYKHYKGEHNIYVLENIVTHQEINGAWTKLQDPWVVYRNLDSQYDTINGKLQLVVKNFMRPLSEFISEVEVGGNKVKRFTPL